MLWTLTFVSRLGVPYDLARGASAVFGAASPSGLDLEVLSIAWCHVGVEENEMSTPREVDVKCLLNGPQRLGFTL